MIVVKSIDSRETLKLMKDYYLLDNCHMILEYEDGCEEIFESDETNANPLGFVEYVDTVIENILNQCEYTQIDGMNKLLVPLLILTTNQDIIEQLESCFIFKLIDESECLNLNSTKSFIQSGFLPIDEKIINDYIKEFIKDEQSDYLNRNEIKVFSMFRDIGYLKEHNNLFEPTDKFIYSLLDTNYSLMLVVLRNNINNLILKDEKYVKSIYEILKLVDFKIIEVIEKQNNN